MSPQRSNRQALIEGALRCLQDGPASRITARRIAASSKANLASIRYHFGSTDALLTIAMTEGFRRWLQELTMEMGDVGELHPVARIQRASEIVATGLERHAGLARAFFAALARAPHDEALRKSLAECYAESTSKIAFLLGLGEDQDATSAASLVLATTDGLLIRALLASGSPLTPTEMLGGIGRLATVAQQSGQPADPA